MRVLLSINFRGTAYSGWQRQTNGVSVQAVIEDALAQAVGAKTVLHGAGRTDAGVHAYRMPAHFDTAATIPADKYAVILNNLLPPDISVTDSREVPRGFHAQFSAVSRAYEYKILITPVRLGLFCDTHWQIRENLDIAAMRRAASLLVGTHDFKAFSSSGSTASTTIKTVNFIEIYNDFLSPTTNRQPPITLTTPVGISIRISADGFLYNMVRIIAAQLVKAGRGQISPEGVLGALKSGNRRNCRECAPAHGLYFAGVDYGATK